MQLKNEFEVAAGAEDTWRLLADLERVAPCMPGASLTGRDGDTYLGNVTIKVGAIGATLDGTAHFVDSDQQAGTATIAMAGKDANGAASADAVLHARLEPLSASSTRVYIDTDLNITGRLAQFGRGAIADVSNRLIRQFTENLRAEITGGSTVRDEASSSRSTPAPAQLDVLSLLGPTAVRQATGAALGFAVGFLVAWSIRRGRRTATRFDP